MYALNISNDGRILSATYAKYAPENAVRVDKLPEGDISEYLYVDGEFIYAPMPVEPNIEIPSQLDIIEAQITYTAMMTGTLLEA